MKIWGIWSIDERKWLPSLRSPTWSSNKENVESFIEGMVGCEVREMTDEDIALIPEAAAALKNWLEIQRLREPICRSTSSPAYWPPGEE